MTEVAKQPKKKSVPAQFYRGDGMDAWGHIVSPREAVSEGGRTVFIFERDGDFTFSPNIEEEERIVVPVQECLVRYVVKGEDLIDPKIQLADVYADLLAFMSDYYVHRNPTVTKFLALYFIASHVLLRAPGIVHVWLVGKRRSGKTTLQLLAGQFCYRAFGGVNPSAASIYRFLGHQEEYAPTILVAEYDKATEFMREICREGDIPGSTVPRCDDENGHQVVHHYHIYGARINASNSLHGEDRDMDRVHVIRSTKGRPKRPRSDLWLNADAMEEVSALRARLLLWKLRTFSGLIIPGEDPKRRVSEGRDWEHYAAVITLASMIDADLEAEIRNYVDECLEGMEREAGEGKTGALVKALGGEDGLFDEKHLQGERYQVSFKEIWERVKKDASPFLNNDGKEVENKLVLESGEVLTTTRAGKILKDELEGSKTSWREGNGTKVKGYEWTEESAREIRDGTGGTSRTGSSEGQASEYPQKQALRGKQGENQPVKSDASSQKPVPPAQPVPKEESKP